MTQLRPILVGTADTKTFFVTYGGDRRQNISALCKTTVERLVGITVNPHAFRTIVASALYEPGTNLCVAFVRHRLLNGCLIQI